jgi:hydrogenase expression/formation protein HypD
MKFIDEYRDSALAQKYVSQIRRVMTRSWTIMEICGGQTHSIVKYGIELLLPPSLTLIHGPGCPVCVTPVEMIDRAVAIASMQNIIFTSFGDMLRVPGSNKDLLSVKAEGGDVRMVYSPLDAVEIASNNPEKNVVFFAVGFETTAPASAMAVWQAHEQKLKNFSILCSHVLVPPAIHALFSSPSHSIQGLLAAGHVCTVMGYDEYLPLAELYRIPITVTGFEPIDILQGIFMTVLQLEHGTYRVENQYSRAVRAQGNPYAKELLEKVFIVTDRKWRGIGEIPNSGLALNPTFVAYDAEKIYTVTDIKTHESELCIAGLVLQGQKRPYDCTAFGKECTPEHPLGAPMVSSEGACAAYFHYHNIEGKSR